MKRTVKKESDNITTINPSDNLWNRYIVYWPVFIVLVLLFLFVATVYLTLTPSQYEIKASILIKDPKKGTEDTKQLESLNPLNSNKIIENELEIMQSRSLMREVVDKLGLYAQIYENVKYKSVSAYTSCPVRIQVANPDSLQESEKIYFSYNGRTNSVSIGGNNYLLNSDIKTDNGTIRFVKNNSYNGNATSNQFYFILMEPNKLTDLILTNLKVEVASKQATILDLVYTDASTKRGEDILNELLSAYSQSIVTNRNTIAVNTLKFVDDRLHKVEHDLDSIEKKNEHYKASQQVTDIPAQGTEYLKNVSINDQKLGEVNMQLAVLEQVENSVENENSKGGIVPSTMGINDAVLTQLLNTLYNLELQAETYKQTTAKNNPLAVTVANQIAKIKPQIVEIVRNQKKSLLASRNNLQSTNSLYSSSLQSLPQKERDLIEINRGSIVKNYIYSFLLQKREETALSFASSVSENNIVDRGQSSAKPVSPKPLLIYSAAIFAALILGIGTITAKETFNNKILFRHEIDNLTSYPVIGEIGYNKSKNLIFNSRESPDYLTEQFRKLRTALIFASKKDNIKKVLVTSSGVEEGKSFIALNLAISLASGGKKVAIVDFDLNNPTITYHLQFDNTIGITSYLEGKTEAWEICTKTDLNENLYAVPAGEIISNSSELLLSDKVEKLFSYLDSNFDFVIIDTAPVNAITDPYILSSYSDATYYVVRHGFTKKSMVEQLEIESKDDPLKNVSIVFNDVRSRGFSKKGFGYGYGFGYISYDKRKIKTLQQSKEQYKLEFPSK